MHDLNVKRAAQGCKKAFQQLYQQHVGRVYGFALRMLNDVNQAEDVTQEIFISAWRQLSSFRGESRFSTWLHAIAARRISDQFRLGGRTLPVEALEDQPLAQQPAPMHEALALETAIQRLPEQARRVFIMHAVEGFSHPQIADYLCIAEGSSKAHYFRARQLLKEWLQDE